MIKKQVPFERNLTSGLIINKKDMKDTRIKESNKTSLKPDTTNYIRIEEDFSNSKNLSSSKSHQK